MNRIIVLIIVLMASASTTSHAAADNSVVMVGDSIGAIVFPLVSVPTTWDAEPSRSPYDTGAEDRAGTIDALTQLVASSPDWVVVQEGASGTKDGRFIPDEEWMRFLNDVLVLTEGSCLVFVLPGYSPERDGNAVAHHRADLTLDLFGEYPDRCIHTIDWTSAADDPSMLRDDGLHPNELGARWLADQIVAVLP